MCIKAVIGPQTAAAWQPSGNLLAQRGRLARPTHATHGGSSGAAAAAHVAVVVGRSAPRQFFHAAPQARGGGAATPLSDLWQRGKQRGVSRNDTDGRMGHQGDSSDGLGRHLQ